MISLRRLQGLLFSGQSLGWGVTSILFLLIVAPLLAVILQVLFPGFFFGERSFAGFGMLLQVFERPLWTRSLLNSLLLASGTAFFGTLLGGILAMARSYFSFPTARLLDVTVWVLLITPSFILAQGWILFASPGGIAAQWLGMPWVSGLIFQPAGLILVMTLSKFSLAYLAVAAAMEWNVKNMDDAARLNGASPLTAWRTVHLPLMLPSFVAGWALVFMDTIGDFGLPASLASVYRFPTLPYSIYSAIYTSPIRFDMAGVLAFYLVIILIASMALLYYAMSRAKYDFLSAKAVVMEGKRVRQWWIPASLNVLFLGIVLGIPVGSSVIISLSRTLGGGITSSNFTLSNYAAVFTDNPLFWTALGNSLRIAGLAAIVSMLIGFLIAYVLTFTDYKHKNWINMFSVISLAVPGVVLGIGYIFIWNQKWLEPLHLHLYGKPSILVLAGIASAIPFAVRLQLGAFAKVPATMLSAAALQGAGLMRRMLDIIVPLVRNSLVVGTIAAFGSGIFDLAVSTILYPPNYSLLPVAINKGFEQLKYGYTTAATIVSGTIVIGMLLLFQGGSKLLFHFLDKQKGEVSHDTHARGQAAHQKIREQHSA